MAVSDRLGACCQNVFNRENGFHISNDKGKTITDSGISLLVEYGPDKRNRCCHRPADKCQPLRSHDTARSQMIDQFSFFALV
ncbi:hypothetical protein NQZ68_018642 [Dissostichus eleginoides]|nr:hypothetical protein NQZ68_018642 [Dissostichus eleginoides]